MRLADHKGTQRGSLDAYRVAWSNLAQAEIQFWEFKGGSNLAQAATKGWFNLPQYQDEASQLSLLRDVKNNFQENELPFSSIRRRGYQVHVSM